MKLFVLLIWTIGFGGSFFYKVYIYQFVIVTKGWFLDY